MTKIRPTDVPQARSLDKVREVVAAVARGIDSNVRLQGAVELTARHVNYHLQAARMLGWLEKEEDHWFITLLGRGLLGTSVGSEQETTLLQSTLWNSAVLKRLAPRLFAPHEPSTAALTDRIVSLTGLAKATARSRANTLLGWRRRVLAPSPTLFDDRVMSSPPQKFPPAFGGHGVWLTGLRLFDFKGFAEASLDLGAFTVLVGANATGKSNLRDAFRFLHGISRGYNLAEIIGEKWIEGGVLQWSGIRGGLREVAHFGKNRFAIEAKLRLRDGSKERTGSYYICIAVDTNGKPPVVVEERLAVAGRGEYVFDSHPSHKPPPQEAALQLTVRLRKTGRKGFIGPTITLPNNRPAIVQLAEHPEVKSKDVRMHIRIALSAFASIRFLDLAPDAMRRPSLPGQTTLGDRGENLSSVLMAICEYPPRKNALLDWLRELTPMDAKDFEFPADQTGRVLVALVEDNGARISAQSASDGTLRFLAIIAALLGPEPAGMYFFEELENGIHPTRLQLLLRLIEQQTSSGACQVVATSHSPELLDFLGPESREFAWLTARLPNQPVALVRRILDLADAPRVLERENLSRLHASGWLEDAADFSEEEP